MREALHWAIEIFFIGAGILALWAIVTTLHEAFGEE